MRTNFRLRNGVNRIFTKVFQRFEQFQCLARSDAINVVNKKDQLISRLVLLAICKDLLNELLEFLFEFVHLERNVVAV